MSQGSRAAAVDRRAPTAALFLAPWAVLKVHTAGPAAARRDGATRPRPPRWPAPLLLLGLVGALLVAACAPDQVQAPAGGGVAGPTPLVVTPPPAASTVADPPVAATPAPPTPPVEAAPTLAATRPVPGSPTTAPIPTAAATPAVGITPTARLTPAVTATGAVAAPGAGGPRVQVRVPDVERLPPLQREIAEAHLRYWNVRSRAYYALDMSQLKDVIAGALLAREEAQFRQVQAGGRPYEGDFELSFEVVEATPYLAVVYEEFVDRGGYLDAATRRRVPSDDPPGGLASVFQMRKTDGVWKVVQTARHADLDAGSAPAADPATPRPSSPLEEVAETCSRYWRALRTARRDLDPSRLSEAMAGAALARAEGEIRELRTARRAAPLRGQVNSYVLTATDDDGVCYSEQVDDGVRLDATTGQALAPRPTPSLVKRASYAKRVAGVWKVVEAADVGQPPAVGSREEEIADAYRRYRQALRETYGRMDPAPLGRVMAGRKLADEQRYFAEGRARGYALRLQTEHNPVVVRAAPDEGIVFDRYLHRSTWMQLSTAKETPADPPSIRTASVVFRMDGGVWKAVDGAAFPDQTASR